MERDDQRVLDALAEFGAEEPLFAFYGRLLRALAEKKAALPEMPLPDLSEMTERLEAEAAALPFTALGLSAATFHPWLLEIAAIFATRDPGVPDEVEEIDQAESLALTQQWYEQGTSGRGPTVDALLANALAPYLEKAAARVSPHLPLDAWLESYCPICGGLPDFALWDARQETRELLCERCQSRWFISDEGCVFCGEEDPERRGLYTTEDEIYRVEVCDSCGFYLKGMDRLQAKRAGLKLIPAAERLLTPGLDLLAAEEGFTRPVKRNA